MQLFLHGTKARQRDDDGNTEGDFILICLFAPGLGLGHVKPMLACISCARQHLMNKFQVSLQRGDIQPLFWGACAMLMDAHNRATDHRVLIVCTISQKGENPFPGKVFAPTAEPLVNIKRIAKTFWQVMPWDTRMVAIEGGVNKKPVILRCRPGVAILVRKQMFNPLLLVSS